MPRPSLILTVELEDFTAKLVVPFELTPDEADKLDDALWDSVRDPSEAAKYAVCDPNIMPDVTL